MLLGRSAIVSMKDFHNSAQQLSNTHSLLHDDYCDCLLRFYERCEEQDVSFKRGVMAALEEHMKADCEDINETKVHRDRYRFTKREAAILELMANDYDQKEIAHHLNDTVPSVQAVLKGARRRFGCRTSFSLLRIACESGVV